MRCMVIVKATPESEKEGALPDPQRMAEMGKFTGIIPPGSARQSRPAGFRYP